MGLVEGTYVFSVSPSHSKGSALLSFSFNDTTQQLWLATDQDEDECLESAHQNVPENIEWQLAETSRISPWPIAVLSR